MNACIGTDNELPIHNHILYKHYKHNYIICIGRYLHKSMPTFVLVFILIVIRHIFTIVTHKKKIKKIPYWY